MPVDPRGQSPLGLRRPTPGSPTPGPIRDTQMQAPRPVSSAVSRAMDWRPQVEGTQASRTREQACPELLRPGSPLPTDTGGSSKLCASKTESPPGQPRSPDGKGGGRRHPGTSASERGPRKCPPARS